MHKRHLLPSLLLSAFALFAGCHKGPQDGVVATVNGKPILRTEVDKVYAAQLANNPQQATPSPDQVASSPKRSSSSAPPSRTSPPRTPRSTASSPR
jgi:hypothetical protein